MNVQIFFLLLSLFLILTFVIICCIAVGRDPTERWISDREQMEYIKKWKEKHPDHTVKKSG